jgi:small nuclear ribonucleoprotein (snRNP)-like protein
MQNRIIVRFTDGKILKGTTVDLLPNKSVFHLSENDSGAVHKIDIVNLKAIYFVKSFEGNRDYQEKSDSERVGLGKRIRVSFRDGETLVGYTQGYSANRSLFIVFPCDPESNNEKVFVVTGATDNVAFV